MFYETFSKIFLIKGSVEEENIFWVKLAFAFENIKF